MVLRFNEISMLYRFRDEKNFVRLKFLGTETEEKGRPKLRVARNSVGVEPRRHHAPFWRLVT